MSFCVILFCGFAKYIVLCMHHYSIIYWVGQTVPSSFFITPYGKTQMNCVASPIEQFFCPKIPLSSPYPCYHKSENHWYITTFIVLPFPECHIVGVVQNVHSLFRTVWCVCIILLGNACQELSWGELDKAELPGVKVLS